jgi:hypothetical protein
MQNHAGPHRGPIRRRTPSRRTALLALAGTAASVASLTASVATAPPAVALTNARWSHTVPGGIHSAAPIAVDLDRDGVDEVVVVGMGGVLQALNADGSLRWQHVVDPTGSGAGTAVDATPTAVDLDGDGRPEIIVSAGSLQVRDQPGGVVAFSPDGQVRWRATFGDIFDAWDPSWGTRGDGIPEGSLGSPAVGDVDGDGALDVVVAALDNRVHALRASDGSPVPGWVTDHPGYPGPGYWVDDAMFGAPLVVDADFDGRDEVFVGATASPGGNISNDGGAFIALEMEGGQARTRWIRFTNEVITGIPVAVDLDLDGHLEVVVGTGMDYGRAQPGRSDVRRLQAFRLHDGATPGGWPVQLDAASYASAPAIGDVDGDGRPDVVAPTSGGGIYAIRGDGQILWHSPTGGQFHSPVIVDVDGNGTQDVLAGEQFLRGTDGARVSGPNPTSEATSAVGRFGGLGWMAIVAGSSGISAHPLPAAGVAPAWPMERGGPALRGWASPIVSVEPTPGGGGYWTATADGTVTIHGNATFHGQRPGLAGGERITSLSATGTGGGYWMFTSRGRVIAYGDAVHRGDMAGTPLNGPVLDSITTPSGNGYYMVASDGGVFSFGDARFAGSMGGQRLNEPVQSLVPDPDGRGYWLVASDGGVFAFDAGYRGAIPAVLGPGQRLNKPVSGMVPYGDGYVLVATDGGAFVFSNLPFSGSLGANPPPMPIVDIAVRQQGGYWMIDEIGRVFAFGGAQVHPLR